jgi:MFS family permease
MLILPALLIPLRDHFGVSITQITFLGTICYFLYGVTALPAGFIADKLGYKAVLTMFFFGTPVAACVVGAARSVLVLGIGLALLGLFASLYHPSGLSMISHNVKQRGKALGLHGMGGNLGLAFSPVVAGMLASVFSWRHSYYLLSLPGFIAGVIFLMLSRNALKDEPSEHTAAANPEKTESVESGHRLNIWAIVMLYAAMTLTGFAYRGMITMLPTYLGRFTIDMELQTDLNNSRMSEELLKELKGNRISLSQEASISVSKPGAKWIITDEDKKYTVMKESDRLNVYGRRASKGKLFDRGNLFATMVLLVGMAGQYMGGHFSDRRRKTRLYLLFNSISLPFIILVGLSPGLIMVLIAALFALFHFANQPVENGLIAQYTPAKLRSSGYGLKFFFTFGVGSFASGFSGYVVDHFGFSSVFLALGGVIFLIVLTVVFLNIFAGESKVDATQ